jgi:hypothetical protein
MAVTSQGKGRAERKARADSTKRKSTVKPKNVPAATLADPRYRSRVVPNVKAYSRKGQKLPAGDEDD